MGVDGGLALETQVVRYRVTWIQLAWFLLLTVLLYGAVALFFSVTAPPDDPFDVSSYVLVQGSIFAVAFVGLSRAESVILTPDALIHRNLRKRLVPWTEVSWITTESLLWVRYVVVYEHSGRRTRLPVPATGFLYWDRDFDSKYRTIGEWFMAHGGQE